MLDLTARYYPSALDQRRGVVRLHPDAMTALGLAPWDVVVLRGKRTTGGLVALAPPGHGQHELLCDELVLGNLGVPDGTTIQVARGVDREAVTVTVNAPQNVLASVSAEMLRTALLGKALTTGDQVSLVPQDLAPLPAVDVVATTRSLSNLLGPAWSTLLLGIASISPDGPAVVTMGTVVGFQGGTRTTGSATPLAATAPSVPKELPGLETQVAALTEWLGLGFHRKDLLAKLGSGPQLGVLVTGGAGSGKAALVDVVADRLGIRVVRAWGPALAGLESSAAARQITSLLEDGSRGGPALVLVEDVDGLAPRDGGEPLCSYFLGAVRQAITAGDVAVVCTTSRPEHVSTQLRAPGTLDHELAIPLPDREQRLKVLQLGAKNVPLDTDVILAEVAARTPGFVAADLLALVREAGLRAAARQLSVETPTVGTADFTAALEVVRPTAMGGARLDLATISLDDVGDMVDVKQAITEAVLWPLQYPDTYTRMGISPARGMLLYGPPGCGKTFLVKAIAGSGQANVLSVKGAELLSKWVGESEAAVRDLFRRARDAAPTLIFLDEVDALAPVRGQSTDGGTTDRVVASLLTELDGVEQLRNVVVIGATNRPDLVDPALLRPGRLEKLVYVPPPDAEARTAILRTAVRSVPLDPAVDLADLGQRTEGFSAADCSALVREAALTAMRESLQATTVSAAHVEAALTTVRPSLDPAQVADLAAYATRRSGGSA